ncbi:MAG: OmpA family protein [Ignavibacteriae bacterium]|nr:OmpA family protein [Ignavibacteriota bacterium]MCB9215074.1 OmpA family protein [Ignavibacteria bacterium]
MKFVISTIVLLLAISGSNLQGQSPLSEATPADPSIRLGIFGGINYSTVSLPSNNIGTFVPDAVVPAGVTDGSGTAPYGGFLFEYIPGSYGLHLRVGYDGQNTSFGETDQVMARLAYLSTEVALRIALGSPQLHILVGPSFSLRIKNETEYTSSTTSASTVTELEGLKGTTFGLWTGLGYDIPLGKSNPKSSDAVWYLTPFVEGHWLVDQVDNQDVLGDAWNTVALRGGIQLKYQFGKKSSSSAPHDSTDLELLVHTPPEGNPQFQEFLPLLNYLFFPEGETSFSEKYKQINAEVAKTFDENQLFESVPTTGAESSLPSSRVQRQLSVYYNLLNIIGSRLRDNPSATIALTGAGATSAEGKEMAKSVKTYLTSTFGIDPDRIGVKGQTKPPHISGTRSTPTEDQRLVQEENNRVEISANDMSLLKPVELHTPQESSTSNNDVTLELVSSGIPIREWNLNIRGNDNSYQQDYGPLYKETTRVNAASILENQKDGSYTATAVAFTENGEQHVRTKDFVLSQNSATAKTATGYSILFGYDNAELVPPYEDLLRTEVASGIPNGSTVQIYGYTDAIGNEHHNSELSVKRASKVKEILAEELKKKKNSRVTFVTDGFGEMENVPFNNTSAEERHYNRTVMIQIIPES